MADNFSWDVVVRLATQGAKQAKGEVEGFSEAVDEMVRTGKVSEKTSEQASRAIAQQGRAAKTASGDVKQMETSINSLRYANYDLATSMFAVSGAITAAGVGVTAAFASQESAFTGVERTAEGALGNIRDALTDLSTQIPYTFNELSEIATLGNQLGIATADLEAFTTTVAQFSTVTGISAEQTALAFGKLGNLLGVSAQDYDRLASSIALVGRTTAATEQQIVSVAGEIAPAAAAAGFTADQVIGLSGALASLKVPPERSRSTILQFFETLNMAAAEGGEKLDNFAQILGTSGEKIRQAINEGQGEALLERFIGNVSSQDTIEITQALDELGLAGLRTNPTIRALAGNMELLQSSVATGAQGWNENTELQRQMAFVLDDLNTKWQTFLNAAMNAAAAVGSSVAPAIGVLLDALNGVLVGFAGFAESDFGQVFLKVAGTVGVVVASLALLRGGIALATASTLAFATVSSALGGAGILSGLRGLASAFGVVTAGAGTAAGATLTFRGALLALGRATVIIGVLQLLSDIIFDFEGTLNNVGSALQWVASLGDVAANAFMGLANVLLATLGPLGAVVGLFNQGVFGQGGGVAKNLDAAGRAVQNLGKRSSRAGGSLKALNASAGEFDWGQYTGELDTAAGGADNLGGAAGGAAQEVRTLVDYANDLQSVFSRAFDIRFAGGSTLDAITSTFISIREATEESARNIRKLKAEIQGLQSDLSIQQYFLGIAIEYGDAQRAAAIQANIAKIQADLADKTDDLTDEQGKNSKSLTGNSKAAIANRAQMEELVKQYQAHLAALAASGLSQDELSRKSQQLRAEFIQQATSLGYSREEVERYAVAFDDMTLAINRVPRNITVTANVNPAIQALNELEARAKSVASTLGGVGGALGSGLGAGQAALNQLDHRVQYTLAAAQAAMYSLRAIFAPNPWEALTNNLLAATWRARMLAHRSAGGFAEGGYTGAGGKYQAAGIVHKGEYVIPKKDVNQRTGLPYADAMGRLQRGASGPGYANGGYVRGGGSVSPNQQISSLGPMAYQQFAQMFADNMRVYLDGQRVSDNSAQHYAQSTAQGAN